MNLPASQPKTLFPFIISAFIGTVLVYLLEHSVLSQTGRAFVYPLDDPFIHMQIARNLAHHGTWGINPQEFGSASSSLLYTLLLTIIFKFISGSVMVPFIINCISGLALLWAVDSWLHRQGIGNKGRLITLLSMIFLLPLPTLVVSGMEHTLQCLLTFLFATKFAEWVEGAEEGGRWRLALPVIVYAMLVSALRYEGLFLVFGAGLILLYKRRLFTAIQLGVLAFVPVFVFGVLSVMKGSFFLPNSVLVKSDSAPLSLGGLAEYLNNIFVNRLTIVKQQPGMIGSPPPGISLLATQRLLIILPLVCWIFRAPLKRVPVYFYALVILTIATVFQLALASTGWFYRYEAYLVGVIAVIVAVLVIKYGKEVMPSEGGKWVKCGLAVLLGFALFFPFVLRSSAASTKAKRACLNIYDQQYQMAHFIHTYYDSSAIAANDIGAISYYSNARIVDLWGLGSIEVARSKKGHYWTPVFLDSLVRAKDVKLAIIYDEWFSPELLHKWTKLATWKMPDNVICGSDIVSFYAIRPEDAESVRKNLETYKAALPREVEVVIF